jgi:hypothetical protein
VCGGEVVVNGEELYGGFGDVDVAAWSEGAAPRIKISETSFEK